MAIKRIDFHLSNHLIQVHGAKLYLFVDGNTRKKPIKLDAGEIMRILRVSDEQIEGAGEVYCDAL
jgi:hypothetical protein